MASRPACHLPAGNPLQSMSGATGLNACATEKTTLSNAHSLMPKVLHRQCLPCSGSARRPARHMESAMLQMTLVPEPGKLAKSRGRLSDLVLLSIPQRPCHPVLLLLLLDWHQPFAACAPWLKHPRHCLHMLKSERRGRTLCCSGRCHFLGYAKPTFAAERGGKVGCNVAGSLTERMPSGNPRCAGTGLAQSLRCRVGVRERRRI